MVTLIPKRARIHDVLSLQQLIEHARDDCARAQSALAEVRARARLAELSLGTAQANLECIVAVYNRLVVEYEPQKGRQV